YPFSHQADMIFMYGKANGNSRLASRLYYESFPNRQQPTHSTFAAVFNRLHETGTLLPSTADRGVQRQRRTPDLEENILQRVEEDPGVSTRQRIIIMERALGRRNRAEILGCVPSLQALEMGKN
ncbi:hypothetical protein J6590_005978, partial [Homalodisca vitripennis]